MPALITARLLAPLLVAVVTAAVFSPALSFPFLPWDDQDNLKIIPGFRGSSSRDLSWIFTSRVMGHYVPLTWASFALDFALWGRNPAGYHATNILLHALNGVLCYFTVRRLLGAAGVPAGRPLTAGALVAALAFAIHPLRVESVAWITERRDVLSGALFFLTVLAYLRAVERSGAAYRGWMGLSLLAFAGSLLAKQITITLPAVLLILDAYPLRRLRGPYWPVIREKGLFALVSAAGVAVLAGSMATDVGFTSIESFGVGARLAMFAYGTVFYPLQTVLPFDLSPLHELPSNTDLLAVPFLPSAVAAVGVTLVAVIARRLAPWLPAAWAYSVLTILPVSGLLFAPGTNLVADRYSYLSTLSLAVVMGGGLGMALARAPVPGARVAATAGAIAVLATWLCVTWWQVHIWRDGETLWRAAVIRNPECGQCHSYLGLEFLAAGRLAEAEREAVLAVRLRPYRPLPHAILASVLEIEGKLEEAARHYRAAAFWDARYHPRAHRALGLALEGQGRHAEAARELRVARSIQPTTKATAELVRTLNRLAAEHADLGRLDEAEQVLEEALRLTPDNREVRQKLDALRDRRRDGARATGRSP